LFKSRKSGSSNLAPPGLLDRQVKFAGKMNVKCG